MELLNRLKKDVTTRNKLLLTIMIMFLLLIGYRIPLPGINSDYLKAFLDSITSSGIGGFVNVMAGSSFSRLSIFALGISPYITASILLQLLAVVVPPLERMSKDGSVGRKKMEKLTVAAGALVAIIESLALAIGFGKQGLFTEYNGWMVLYATVVWTAGACFLIWVGQTITNKLIGNGTSLIILFNILTTLPGDMTNIFNSLARGSEMWVKLLVLVAMIFAVLIVFAYVVVLNNAEKRIHITNSAKAGMRMTGANENIMPIRLHIGGVMPIIFASSLMSVPAIISNIFDIKDGSIVDTIIKCFSQGNWFNPDKPIYTLGVLAYIPLIFVFAYFYSTIHFNTKDIANNLRKGGSTVDGIRPGQPTADYLKKQVNGVLLFGTAMLVFVALLPTLISGLCNIDGLSFGGTTIIIVVGAILEMRNTLNAQTSSVAYKSLIKTKGGAR